MFKNFKISFLKIFGFILAIFISFQVIGFLINDLVKVDERQMAVITRFGKIQKTVAAGWHFKIPWIDRVAEIYQLDTQSKTILASAATSDQQSADVQVNIQFKVDPNNISELYKKVSSQEYLNETIMPPIIQEAVKSSTAAYSAVDLLEKRDSVKLEIQKALQDRVKDYGVNILAVNVENIDFSDQFDLIIEQKVVAKQEVERQKELLKKAELEIEIEKAKAESTRVQGEALRQNPEVIEIRKIEKWDGKLPQVQSDGSTIVSIK